jgi:hypothetical protein
MEAGWIFRVKVSWGTPQVLAVMPCPIKSPKVLQPHLGGDIEQLLGVLWFSRTCPVVGFSRSSRRCIDGYSFFFVSGADVVFLTRSATSRMQPITLGRLREEWQRRHATDTVWRLKTKGISRITL